MPVYAKVRENGEYHSVNIAHAARGFGMYMIFAVMEMDDKRLRKKTNF